MGAGAALFERHVFVDLETTGLDPASDRVIELGALFVERGVPVQRLSRLFDPGIEVPAEVQLLTGLRGADLVGHGDFGAFLGDLADALRGWTLVAHNAEFERSFLQGLLERENVPLIDSCELAHYLYPELPSHSLDALIRYTGTGPGAKHRALQDCEDTFAVMAQLLDRTVAHARIDRGRFEDLEDLLACLGAPGMPDRKSVV